MTRTNLVILTAVLIVSTGGIGGGINYLGTDGSLIQSAGAETPIQFAGAENNIVPGTNQVAGPKSSTRTIADQTAQPGDVVEVTIKVTLSSGGERLQITDDFSPESSETNINSISYNGDPVLPVAAVGASGFIEVALEEDFQPGDTISVTYEVTVPQDPGQEEAIEFSGFAALDDTQPVNHTGDSAIQIETNDPPTADAGPNQTVEGESSVQLDATGSSDPDGDDLSYEWVQTAGPSVDLSDDTSPTPSFTAPAVDSDQTLTFELEVNDGKEGTDTDTVDVVVEERPDPANFDVTIDETNSPVNEGEEVTIMATIENTGDVGGTQEVTLDAGGLGTDSASVTLDGGESTTETLSVVTEAGYAGDYTATVASDNDTDSADIAVQEQPEPDEAEFVLSNLNPTDATVTEGDEPIDISADVENVGDETGQQDLELTITNESGAVVYTDTLEDIELNGGESTTVTFEDAPAGDLSSGEYTHEVSSEDDDIAGSLTVEEAPDAANFQLSNLNPADATVTEGDEPIDISADVQNTGDQTSQQDLELTITNDTGSVVYSDIIEGVELNGGESTTVTFEEAPAGDLTPGEYTHEVTSNNDTVSGSLTVEEMLDEAFFEVAITGSNSPVVEGDTLELTADIENTGDMETTQDIELDAGGLGSDSVSVTLDGGESTTETLSVVTEAGDAGDYTATVASDNATDNVDVTVQEQPDEAEFVLSNLNPADATVTEGDEPINISADIENVGDQSGEQDIELSITNESGAVVYTDTLENVELNGGEINTVTFEDAPTGDLAPGEYTHEISSNNDDLAGSLTVDEAPEEADFQLSNLNPADATVTEGDEPIDISADVENVGDETDQQDLELTITNESGAVVYADTIEDIELDGGESTTVTFEDAPAGDLAPGEYTHAISSVDDDIAGSLAVEETPEEADFQLSNLDPAEATVTEGDEPIDISADIENIGDQSGEQNIELSITNESGAVVYTDTLENVELSGGEARTVTFEDAPAGDITPGEYTHSVVTANDRVAGTLVVVAANQSPTADAGESQTVEEGDSVTLNASGSSDPDGDALSYTWTQTAGPSVSLSNTSAETPSFTAPEVDADSNLVFEVTVSDGNGGTATDTVTITVQNVTAPEPDNRPPSADAGEDQTVDERATVQLDADGSTDPDGDILTYNWTQTAGPSVTLSEQLVTAPTFTAPTVTEETTLTFQTKARDGNGGTDTDTVNVTVLPVNDPPTADAGPDQTVNSGATVTLNASGSTDPEGDTLAYEWEPVSRANVTLSDADTATPSFTASDVDVETVLSFEVTVSDGNGGTDTDTVDIRIEPIEQPVENQPPVADAGPDQTVSEESTATLDATGSSDPDGDALEYSWAQTSGPNVTLSEANTATPSFTTPTVEQPTDLTFEVTVSDGQGETDTETVTVTVQPVTEGEAFFAVTNLNAPDEVAQGDQLTISATITNTGDAEGTQLIEARVDANRDGRQEVIQTESVTLASGESTTVTTTRTVPADLSTGTYTGGLFTFDSNQTTSVAVISAEPPAENYTRNEIAQAKYGLNFSELSNETARQVEELYLRQPFTDGAQPEDVKTREEIAQERYGEDFENLSRETTIEIQSDFDAQFGDTGANAEYSRDEISQAKYYGYNFSELSTETSGQVEELYNRQPFADGLSPSDVQTREEIANEKYGLDVDELSRETRLEVEQTYHEQFEENESEEE